MNTSEPTPPASTTAIPQVTNTAIPAPTDGQPTGGRPSPGTLELKTAVVKLARDGTPSVLNEGEEMSSCLGPDQECYPLYGMYFYPNQAAYVYAFQQDSTGQVDTLFPNEEYSEQVNPVPASTVVWVPKDPNHWFYLDENVGQETIYIVAGSDSIDELENLAGNVRGDIDGRTNAAAQIIAYLEGPGDRGVGGLKKEVVTVKLPGGTEEEESLEVVVVEATEENQFVYQISFQHVAPAVLQ